MELFEKLSKQKVRFETNKGLLIPSENLWELSLPSLDEIAKKISKELKSAEEESFIKETTPVNTLLKLKLDTLKHIIDYKLNLKDRAKKKAEKDAKLAKLKEIYSRKADSELEEMSKEDLEKAMKELE